MGKRQRDWAAGQRKRLSSQLGGVCNACGATDDLQFHVIGGGHQRHHGLDPSRRMSFYRKMARLGKVRLLCRSCHAAEHIDQKSTKVLLSVLKAVNTVNNSPTTASDSQLQPIEKEDNQ